MLLLLLLWLLLLSLPFFLIFLFLFKPYMSNPNDHKNLPPGPPPFPIIGNLFQLGSKPHITLAQLAQLYGPLFSLRLGYQLVVVASSSAAASEVLKVHDNIFSGRYVVYNARSKNYIEHSMVWAPECTEGWKNLRRICRLELFSSMAIEAQGGIREMKVLEMIRVLREKEGEVVKVSEVVFGTIFNVIGCMVFSKDVFDMGGVVVGKDNNNSNEINTNNSVRDLKGHLCKMLELGSGTSFADCFPLLGWMTWGRQASEECRRNVFGCWKEIIRERRELLGFAGADNDHDDKNDFLSSLIKAGFNNDQINALLLEIFGAAADTTTSTIEWAMVEIMKNPYVMHKLQSELAKIKNNNNNNNNNYMNPISEIEDLPRLPYLQALVKETLRLYPPTPLLIPRRTLRPCKVMNYIVPRECQVLVNAWAIGRDPKVWGTNASNFLPERFLGSQVDYKGTNSFEFVPFGGGRRVCPGMPLASQLVPLIIASLLHNFDWFLPNGMSPCNLSTNEKFGLTLKKDPPLLLVLKAKGVAKIKAHG